MKYSVNEEGVQALSRMANSSLEAVPQTEELNAKIGFVSENNLSVLGPHKQSLDTAIEDINLSLQQAVKPIETVSEKLQEVDEAYSEIIGNDKLKSVSNGTSASDSAGAGQARAGSFLGRIFGGKRESSGSQKFGSFETEKY